MTDTKWLDVNPIRERHRNAVAALEKFLDGDYGHHTVSAGVWRVVQSDSENMDAIAPRCGDPRHREFGGDDGRVRECCDVGLAIETPHEKAAAFLAAVFVDVPVLAAEVERLRAELASTQPLTLAETLRETIHDLRIHIEAEADRLAAPLIKDFEDRVRAAEAEREATIAHEQQRRANLVAETRRQREACERHADQAEAETAKARAEVERLRGLFGEALDKVDTVAGARFLTDRYRSRLAEGGQGGAS